jgi:hypothetical protein
MMAERWAMSNTTIHPELKIADLRDDGWGGLDLIVTTHTQETHVYKLSPERCARWLARLADHAAQKLKERG